MYTDEDLNNAIDKGIFSDSDVTTFRNYIAQMKNTPAVDEENFRLISGFNDIFVIIASFLLLASSGWVASGIHHSFAMLVIAMNSWLLSEFFVRKRKMALPAIIFLITFVGGIFAAIITMQKEPTENIFMVAALISAIATFLHWRRFKVPITIAAGVATIITFVISLILSIYPDFKNIILYCIFTSGVITFCFAMYWDASDRKRITQKSDIAFWLHLLSAPLIVHPICALLGVLKGSASISTIISIIAIYIFLSTISLAVDRRAFMVSSLAYVLFALTSLFKEYGLTNNSLAFAGVFISLSLLFLSGFWQNARKSLIKTLPCKIQKILPIAS